MKTTKIYIKNLFGITEKQLDGKSVEITGKNGSGKTSVLDAIRYALYEKCKEKGLQFIATRTTDDDCLEVTAL